MNEELERAQLCEIISSVGPDMALYTLTRILDAMLEMQVIQGVVAAIKMDGHLCILPAQGLSNDEVRVVAKSIGDWMGGTESVTLH